MDVSGHSPERGAEAHGPDGGGKTFSGHIGHGNEEAAVGQGDQVEVVTADFVAGDRAKSHRVAGDGGQGLRKQGALNGASRFEILLDAGELEVALVVAGVFKSDSGLEGKALDEVGLVDGELATAGRGDQQFGHALATAVVERPSEAGAAGSVCCDRVVTIREAGGWECGAIHLKLADNDAQHLLEDFVFLNGGMDLP